MRRGFYVGVARRSAALVLTGGPFLVVVILCVAWVAVLIVGGIAKEATYRACEHGDASACVVINGADFTSASHDARPSGDQK